jgi:hypothetical protein
MEEKVALLHGDTTRAANRLEIVHEKRLKCRLGCSSCCVDDLTVFPVEADHIRRHHSVLLTTGTPHAKGMCAFLDAEGGCRIYNERPYVCRTQGLPLRWLEQRADLTVELRDICPLNDENVDLDSIEGLPIEECWTIGPFEDRLAALQLVSTGGAERTSLRDLFVTK